MQVPRVVSPSLSSQSLFRKTQPEPSQIFTVQDTSYHIPFSPFDLDSFLSNGSDAGLVKFTYF